MRELELEVVDVEALRPRIEVRLTELGRQLAEDGRDALRALFRGERLRVGPDTRAGLPGRRESLAAAAGGGGGCPAGGRA